MSAVDVAVLRALREAGVHCTGGDMAGLANVPLAELETSIARLRDAGYEIEERPGLGYRLLQWPDRLIADDLWSRMDPARTGSLREIAVYEQTDSTNDRAAALGRDGVRGTVAIFAESQTAGRGRFGRTWQSARHTGIWFSLLLRPAVAMAQWPRLTTCAAVAIANAVEKCVPVAARIKWPNDIQISGRKLAGILMETGVDRAGDPFAVLGIGLNANHGIEDFPEELREKATSLRISTGQMVDRAMVAASVIEELGSGLDSAGESFGQVLEEARRRSTLLGQWVQLNAGGSLVEGVAEGLDDEGRLLLRRDDGSVEALSGGEVSSDRGFGPVA